MWGIPKLKARDDLSEWVVHFVHGMKPELVWMNEDGESEPMPVAFDEDDKGIVLEYQTYRHPLSDFELSAFDVLLRIIDDGYLQTSWSLRERADGEVEPTIYGRRSALCVTEIPLHALTAYQQKRAESGYVDKYAIAVNKGKFFSAGGRIVYSGLSQPHKEVLHEDRDANYFCRILSPECGLAEHEQYRYVAMNMREGRHIDWSHEREWRWTKSYDVLDFTPGLPLWLQDRECDPDRENDFSEIIVITETEEQISAVVDKLRALYDSGKNEFGIAFDKKRLRSTKVTSFARIEKEGVRHIRDIKFSFSSFIRKITYNDEVTERAKEVYELSRAAAQEAVESLRTDRDEREFSFCGGAELVLKDSHNEYVRALIAAKIARPGAGEGYIINVNDMSLVQQSMELASRGCEAAGSVFFEELGLNYDVRQYPD